MTPYDLIVKCCHICLGKKEGYLLLAVKSPSIDGNTASIFNTSYTAITDKKGCIENNTIDKLIIAWEKVT